MTPLFELNLLGAVELPALRFLVILFSGHCVFQTTILGGECSSLSFALSLDRVYSIHKEEAFPTKVLLRNESS